MRLDRVPVLTAILLFIAWGAIHETPEVRAVASETSASWDSRIMEYSRIREESPDSFASRKAAFHIGELYYRSGEMALAREWIEKASPYSDFDRAERHLAQAILLETQYQAFPQRVYPGSVEAREPVTRAERAIAIGNYREAFTAIETVMERFGNSLLLEREGRFTGVWNRVRSILTHLDQDGVKAALERLRRRGLDPEEARTPEAILAILKTFPLPALEAELFERLGDWYLDHGRFARASGFYREAALAVSSPEDRERIAAKIEKALSFLPMGKNSSSPVLVSGSNPLAIPVESVPMYTDLAARFTGFSEPDWVFTLEDGAIGFCTGGDVWVTEPSGAVRFVYRGADWQPERQRASFRIENTQYFRSSAMQEFAVGPGTIFHRVEGETGSRGIVALNAWSGAVLWDTRAIHPLNEMRIVSGPVYAEGVVLLLAFQRSRLGYYRLIGLDAESGEVLWDTGLFSGSGSTHLIGEGELDAGFGGPAIAVAEGRVYVGGHMGSVSAVNLHQGRLLWTTSYPALTRAGPRGAEPVPYFSKVTAKPAVGAGYVAVLPRDSNTLYAFSTDNGTVLAEFRSLDFRDLSGTIGDAIYTRQGEERLAAWSVSERREIWQTVFPAPIHQAAVMGSSLVARSGDNLHFLDLRTGEVERTEKMPSVIASGREAIRAAFHPVSTVPVPEVRTGEADRLRLAWIGEGGIEDILADREEAPSRYLLFRAGRISCHGAGGDIPLLWETPIRPAPVIYSIENNVLYLLYSNEIVFLELDGGEVVLRIPWEETERDSTSFQSCTAGEGTVFVSSRKTLEAFSMENGSRIWRQHLRPGTEIGSMLFDDGLWVLIRGGDSSPLLRRLRTADGATLAEIPIVYPVGLTQPMDFEIEKISGIPIGNPIPAEGRSLTARYGVPLNISITDGFLTVLCTEGAGVLLDEKTIRWFPLPMLPRSDSRVMRAGDEVAVTFWEPGGWKLQIVDRSGLPRPPISFGPEAGLLGNRYFPPEWSRPWKITCRETATGEMLWQSPGMDVFGHLFVTAIANRVYALMHQKNEVSSNLFLLDIETGEILSEHSIPFPYARTLSAWKDGCFVQSGVRAAYYALTDDAMTREPIVSVLEDSDFPGRRIAHRTIRSTRLTRSDSQDAEYTVRPSSQSIAVDGFLEDWTEEKWWAIPSENFLPRSDVVSGTIPLNSENLSAEIAIAESLGRLCMGVRVKDGYHAPARGSVPAFGDSLEVRVRDPRRTFRRFEPDLLHFFLTTRDGLTLFRSHPPRETNPFPVSVHPWPRIPSTIPGFSGAPETFGIVELPSMGTLPGPIVVEAAARRDEERKETSYEFSIRLDWLVNRPPSPDENIWHDDPRDASTLWATISIHESDGTGIRGTLEWNPAGNIEPRMVWANLKIGEEESEE